MSRPAILAACVAAVIVGSFASASRADCGSKCGVPVHYDAPTLRALHASGVRIMLPLRLPAVLASTVSIAVIDADRESYYVGFSHIRRCGGGLSCTFLHVAGYRLDSPAGRAYATDPKFNLPDGSRGSYTSRDCSGAHCSESSLAFERNGAIYEIDANAGRHALPVLLAVAGLMRFLPPQPVRPHGR